MVNQIELRGYSSSVIVNSTFRVVHTHFEVDVDMMMIYVNGENGTKWILDTMDYGGVRNLKIDGVVMSDKESQEYFDFLKKLKVDYEDQVIRSVEALIENFTDKDVEEMIYRRMGTEKLPTKSEKTITYEDVIKICDTIEKYLYYDEVDEVISRYQQQSENDNWAIVVEDLIYQVYGERK